MKLKYFIEVVKTLLRVEKV